MKGFKSFDDLIEVTNNYAIVYDTEQEETQNKREFMRAIKDNEPKPLDIIPIFEQMLKATVHKIGEQTAATIEGFKQSQNFKKAVTFSEDARHQQENNYSGPRNPQFHPRPRFENRQPSFPASCGFCGFKGHTAKDCRKRHQGTCTYCRQMGHQEDICFEKMRVEGKMPKYFQSVTCNACNKMGHLEIYFTESREQPSPHTHINNQGNA